MSNKLNYSCKCSDAPTCLPGNIFNLMKAEVLVVQHQFRVGQFPYSLIVTRESILPLQNTLPLQVREEMGN